VFPYISKRTDERPESRPVTDTYKSAAASALHASRSVAALRDATTHLAICNGQCSAGPALGVEWHFWKVPLPLPEP